MMFSGTVDILSASLDWAAERQELLIHNIANADTPGYKRKDLAFPRVLAEKKLALATTHPRHLPGSSWRSSAAPWHKRNSARVDESNVDLDIEMARLAENTMYYQGLADRLNGKFKNLRTAIGGR